MDTLSKGRQCEDAAARMYTAQGYLILGRNYRSRYGEIDIICSKDSVIVFSEVKSIPDGWDAFDMHRKIPPAKIHRIRHTAREYLAHNSNDVYDTIRFDAVFVSNSGTTCIQGAF